MSNPCICSSNQVLRPGLGTKHEQVKVCYLNVGYQIPTDLLEIGAMRLPRARSMHVDSYSIFNSCERLLLGTKLEITDGPTTPQI